MTEERDHPVTKLMLDLEKNSIGTLVINTNIVSLLKIST